MPTLTYKPLFSVFWNGRHSRRYLMNKVLALAKRMRGRGHAVTVTQHKH